MQTTSQIKKNYVKIGWCWNTISTFVNLLERMLKFTNKIVNGFYIFSIAAIR